jgi:uncharacterized protein YkwD
VEAKNDVSVAFGQYLPITFAESCVPRPLIPPNDPDKDLALENGINQIRANHGMPLLKHSDKIAQAALRHSNDMAHNGFVDTVGSDGSDPGDRAENACYHWQAYDEIIVAGPRTPNDAIAAWMSNQVYKDYILSNDFTEFGAAYSYNKNTDYKHYYTVDFGLRDFTSSSTQKGYYSCTYATHDETGAIWLNLYSIGPCDELISSLSSGG